jgi:hypothetical protein
VSINLPVFKAAMMCIFQSACEARPDNGLSGELGEWEICKAGINVGIMESGDITPVPDDSNTQQLAPRSDGLNTPRLRFH